MHPIVLKYNLISSWQLEELLLEETGQTLPSPDDLLECVAHDCPTIMRKGMPATLLSAFSYDIMDRRVS